MSYSTLMVHLDLGVSNAGVLAVAADLAQRFDAHVVGIAACQPLQIPAAEAYMSTDVIELDRTTIERQIREAETQFRTALTGKARSVEWRSAISFTLLAGYIAQEARAADLLITAPDRGADAFDSTRRVDISDLVMRLGRPVLVVPPTARQIDLHQAVIGWNETRESRRAVLDALPLLKLARAVCVVTIVDEDDIRTAQTHLADVVSWFSRHGITASSLAVPSFGDDAARLQATAEEMGATLFVGGAYGHNRLREWALGGVTRDLLLAGKTCSLISH